MKKSRNIILSVLLAVCAFCLCFALVGCSGGGDDKADKYGYGEEGFYYYDGADSSRYMLSLQSGTYMITMNGASAYSGTYSYDEESGTVSFKGDNEFAATLGESALSLSMEGSGYSFKAYKFFDVTYVDETGKTIATESVLNGQTAEALEIEKDGYWFIDWYADSSNSATYSFDTSIAGDTTIYGWYIEKNTEAVEHTITLDYGDGVTEAWDTTNGAIYKTLPESHDGKAIIGWWVSATNKSGELTYKYAVGDVFDADTTLFAVYSGIGSSVTSAGITWDTTSAGSNVSIEIKNSDGERVIYEQSLSSTSGIYTSSAFTGLESGVYTVEITSGSITDTLVYVVNGLARVSLSSADIVENGSGRVLSFAPVDGADGYLITVTNGERTVTEDLGSHTYYNFSSWEMTKEGITFVVTAYGEGYAESVSDAYTYIKVLGDVSVTISDDVVSWNRIEGALEYAVTISDVDGVVVDSFYTSDTSFSLKYYKNGTYDITVQPHTDGYYSEAKTYYGYAKDSLAAPQITDVTDYTVSWTEIEGADSYVVLINGVEYEVKSGTTLNFGESNVPETASSYEISVKAVKNGGSDSPYSDAVVATVEFSSAVSYDRNRVYWNYDIEATSYGISVNGGTETIITEGNSAKVTLTKVGDNLITVTAYDGDDAIGYAETTVYAYSITLDPNGAELVNDTAVNGVIYVAQGDELDLGTVELEHADFLGWYTQADYTNGQSDEYEGKGSLVEDGSTFTGNGSMYLYAYWSYEYIDVTLIVGMGSMTDETGASVETLVVPIKYNSTTYVLPVPTAYNAEDVFDGWFTGSNGSGDQYTTGSGVAVGEPFTGECTTLYAYYLAVLYYSRTSYNGETVYAVSAGSSIRQVSDGVVTIPESYNGYNLVINSSAFENCTTIKVLNIPDTVLYISVTNDGYRIGTGAFEGCLSLEAVNVYATGDGPDSTKEVMYYSADGVLFHKMKDSEDVEILYYPYGKEAQAYSIPSSVSNEYECDYAGNQVTRSVTTVPSQVFRGRKLTSVTIPYTVTDIASSAFYSNTELKTVYFEAGGTDALVISDRAFRSCSAITDVTLPARYTDFNAAAFTDCTALVNVYVEAGGTYSSDNGILLDSTGTEIVYYPMGRSGDVVISEITSGTITKIGKSSFANNTNITSLVISASVTEICESAFEGCTWLGSLTFLGTDNSPDLTIRSRAFYGCAFLTEITLPSNLTKMEANAFGGCNSLTTVRYNARKNANSTDIDFATGSFGTSNYIRTLYLGVYVPEIDFVGIFDGGQLYEVIIEETEIDGQIVKNQYYFSDDGVVYDAQKSKILYYPLGREGSYKVLDTTTTIGSDIFAGRLGLTSIEIGQLVNSIGADAFDGCTYLEKITVDSNNTTYGSDEYGILYGKGYNSAGELVFVEIIYDPLAGTATALTLSETVVKTSANAFKNNTTITSVKFSEDAESFELGANTFDGCTNLTEVSLPDVTAAIPAYAFNNCSSLAAFAMPSEVTAVGDYAFYSCKSLVGDLTDSSNGVTLPEGLVTIGMYAFYNDQNLAVTIPSTVSTIGDYAFYSCWYSADYEVGIVFAETANGEQKVNLTIGAYAFDNTSYATSLEIPSRVVSIGDYAFRNFGCLAFDDGSSDDDEPGPPPPASLSNSAQFFDDDEPPPAPDDDDEPPPPDDDDDEPEDNGERTPVTFEEGCTLQTLGEGIFYSASKIGEIEIPSSVTSIGRYTFRYCTKLEEVTFATGTQLQTIGYGAFQESGLVSVEIPASVITIGDYAFEDCYDLVTLEFAEGSSLETIGACAFFSCSSIVSLELPASLTSLGRCAFYANSSLENISFQNRDSDGNYTQASGLKTLSYRCFYNCKNLTSVDLPANLEETGSGGASTSEIGLAFELCSALTTISIPSTVTNIDNGTFTSCTALTTITFETDESGKTSLARIGDSAFSGCTALSSFTFPDSTATNMELGDKVFNGCTFSTVAFSDSVTDIGTAFIGLTLTSFVVEDTHPAYMVDNTNKVLYSKDQKTIALVFGEVSGDIEIPDTIESIGSSAFYGQTGLTSVSLPASLLSIGNSAFYNCTSLTSVTVRTEGGGSAEYTLGEYAFYGCTALTYVDLPDDLTEIPSYCFYNCPLNGEGMTFPESITHVGTYAMYGTSIESITLPSIVTIDSSAFRSAGALKTVQLGGGLTSIGTYAFRECKLLESINLPAGITTISGYAFYYCYALKSITIPEGVITIDEYAFYYCTGLEEAVIADTVSTIGNFAFRSCTSLAVCNMPRDLTSLGSGAFRETLLTSVVLPDNLEKMADNVFRECYYLESVVMNAKLVSIGDSSFRSCTSLKSITMGAGVTTLSGSMFNGCTSLVYAYTGDSLTSLGSSMFSGCTALETVEFGPSLKEITSSAFSNCTSLKEIVLENGLETIAGSAFNNCSSIESLVIPSSVTSVAASAFDGCSCDIYVYNSKNHVSTYWKSGWMGTNSKTAYYYTSTEPAFNSDGTDYDDNYWFYDENKEMAIWTFSYATYTVEDGGYVLYDEAEGAVSYVCLPDEDADTSTVYTVSECTSDTSDGTYSVTLSNGGNYTVVLTDTDGTLTATVTPKAN